MRKIAEIRQDLSAKIAEVKGMTDKEQIEKGLADIETLSAELENANKLEAAEQKVAERKFHQMEQAAGRKFSLVKFVREASERNLTGLEAEVAKMGAEEYKRMGLQQKGAVIPSCFLRSSAGQNAGTNADGGYMKEVMPIRYVDALKDRLVVAGLGANILGDLYGTLPVVSAGEITAAFKAEGAQTSVSKSTISRVELTPHRASIVAAFSKDLFVQSSPDVEKLLMDKILNAHATLIDRVAIAGDPSVNSAEPTGILNTTGIGSVAGGTNGAAISWANIVALETAVNAANGNRGKLGYLTNAKVIGQMKASERTQANGRYLLDAPYDMVNGYKIDWTNLVPSTLTKGTATSKCSAMIFGNFEDLYIGQWGGLDIVVDPYTLADYGDVRLILNAYNDVKVVNAGSFAAIKDILA